MKPMLAHDGDLAEAVKKGWTMEAKWDGIRLLADIHGFSPENHTTFYTREENAKRLPKIERALRKLPAGTVLDGEAVCLTGAWNEAQSGVQSGRDDRLTYVVFDMLALDNLDTTGMPFRARRKVLEDLFKKIDSVDVRLGPQMEATRGNYDMLLKIGFEGAMLKDPNARYYPGRRSSGWGKLKAFSTLDAVITGYEPGKDVGTILFSQYDPEGNLVLRGRCKALKGVHTDVERRIACQQVIEIKHNGIMRSGALRHPQLVRVRDDKPARECLL